MGQRVGRSWRWPVLSWPSMHGAPHAGWWARCRPAGWPAGWCSCGVGRQGRWTGGWGHQGRLALGSGTAGIVQPALLRLSLSPPAHRVSSTRPCSTVTQPWLSPWLWIRLPWPGAQHSTCAVLNQAAGAQPSAARMRQVWVAQARHAAETGTLWRQQPVPVEVHSCRAARAAARWRRLGASGRQPVQTACWRQRQLTSSSK